jgi:cobalamin biosynthetic protein CobC
MQRFICYFAGGRGMVNMNNIDSLTHKSEFNHGGKLEEIKSGYPRQKLDWIDLSTGISPFSYPIDDESIDLTGLPQHQALLTQAAREYYKTQNLTVIPGSMWAIQMLPVLRKLTGIDDRPVLLPKQGFNEHQKSWRAQGYNIEVYDDAPTDQQLNNAQACVVINPNNPTGRLTEATVLKTMLKKLTCNGAWLIVDEAFIDPYEISNLAEYSMSNRVPDENLIVLRSFGKFFGLAGLRLGAILAHEVMLNNISSLLNNWSIHNYAQAIGIKAWLDHSWHSQTNEDLALAGERLRSLFITLNCTTVGTVFFQTLYIKNAQVLYELLLSKGIYTRLLDNENGIRFGLPSTELHWQRLEQALTTLHSDKLI